MNIVKFITDTVNCEASPNTATCRLFRKSLVDLNVSYETLDLRKTPREINSYLESLGLERVTTIPYILILDSNSLPIFHFGVTYIANLINIAGDDTSTELSMEIAIKKHIKNTLVLYGAISE